MNLRGTPPYSFSLWSWGLNEESLVEKFVTTSVDHLSRVADDFEIILIDDGSTDRTWQIMQECAKKYPCLKIVRHEKNLQPGWCMHTCCTYTTKQIVFWNTVDMFFDSSKLPEFLKHLDRFDVVQGVRTGRKSNTYKSFYRRMNSIINYQLIKFLFKVPLQDFQNVTFLRWDFLKHIHFDSHSSFTNPECVIRAYYSGLKIKEVAMEHKDRESGKAKGGRPSTVLAAVVDILKCWFLWRVVGKITITEGEVIPCDQE
jgi:glycosyltransferase involved in cell wall biosynthesis